MRLNIIYKTSFLLLLVTSFFLAMFIKDCWPGIEINDIYSKELEEKKFCSFLALCFKLKGRHCRCAACEY